MIEKNKLSKLDRLLNFFVIFNAFNWFYLAAKVRDINEYKSSQHNEKRARDVDAPREPVRAYISATYDIEI